MNEYQIVLIEVLIALMSGYISIQFIFKLRMLNLKEFGYRLIGFLVLFVFTLLYVIEYQQEHSILLLICWFNGILFASVLVFIFFVLLFNFGCSIFREQKYSRFHIIQNVVENLSSMNIKYLLQLSILVESCFIFTCLFSLGSILVTFVTYFFLQNTQELFLLEIGPSFILWFVVFAQGLGLFSMFITFIYVKRIKQHNFNQERFLHKNDIQKENEW